MSKYKIKIFIKGLLLLLLLCIICYFIWNHFEKKEKDKSFDFTIRTSETKTCSSEVSLYYTSTTGVKYYLNCLDYIIISRDEEDKSLSSILNEDPTFIEEIIKEMRTDGVFWDGGSILYKDANKNEFTNHGLAILKCKTSAGNRDYYIGPSNMEYKSGYCMDSVTSKNDELLK